MNSKNFHIPLVHLEMVKESSLYCSTEDEDETLSSPEKIVSFVAPLYHNADREKAYVCALDSQCRPQNISLVSIGGMSSCMIPLPDLFKTAILSNSPNIILIHNHPSGNPSPSREDDLITRRVKAAADLLGISLTDHIITGSCGQYYSYHEKGDIL